MPTAQRECSAKSCTRTDVQPGTYHPPETCRRRPAAFCPRHLPSETFFTPTLPDAESLRAANDEMLTTGRGERVACYCGGRGKHLWQPPLCPVVRVTEPAKTCWCRANPSGHVYAPEDYCPDDHPTDPFNGPSYVRASDGGAVMCVCSRTRALHHWNRDLGCPPDLDPKEDPVNEVSAQVQCYCTGRGPDSASGHLWRKDRGCPNSPTQPFTGTYRTPAEQSDDHLLAELFERALRLRLLALDVRFNAIGELHVRPNVTGATIDLNEAEVEAIKRRFAR